MLMYTAELKNSRKMPLAEKREKVLRSLATRLRRRSRDYPRNLT